MAVVGSRNRKAGMRDDVVIRLAIVSCLSALFACGGGGEDAPVAGGLGKLAFVQNGDLWVRDLPDGLPRRLTTDGRTQIPRWSPSGDWVASSRDGQLRVIRLATGEVAVLNGGAAVEGFGWSPESDTLAYATTAGLLRLAGPEAWQDRTVATGITAGESRGGAGFAWSPDGRWLAYARNAAADAGGGGGAEGWSVWRIRADGRDEEHLAAGGAGGPEGPAGALVVAWPEADRILFWSDPRSASLLADGTSLHELPADGGEPTEIVRSMLAYPDFLDVAPDGGSLVVARGAGRESWSHKRLVLVDLSSGKATGLTDESVAAIQPDWSPDMDRIVYVAAPDKGFLGGGEEARGVAGARRVWVVTRGGSAKALTSDTRYRDERPLWSADGARILFARLEESAGASLWLMSAEGLGLQQVAALSPAPEWFGFFGHVDWGQHFDWWRGSAAKED